MTNKTFSGFSQWYDQRPLRERVVLLVCLLIILLLLMNFLILRPFSQQRHLAHNELRELKTRVAELESQKAVIEARKGSDPDQQSRLRLVALEKESEKLQQQLKLNIVNLVSPSEMPELLKDLLTRQKKLRLLSLENLAPEQLQLGPKRSEDAVLPTLYRHRLKLEFAGDYLTLLKYLRQLEELPRSMIWEKVEVESDDYPKSIVRVQVYTLSLTEGWIGG